MHALIDEDHIYRENKWAIKLMIVALVIAAGGLFFIEGPDGNPLLSLDDLGLIAASFDPRTISSELLSDDSKASSGPTTIYKWKDEEGIWQFSNTPVEQPGVEVMEVDGNVNIIQALDMNAYNRASDSSPSPTSQIRKEIPGVMTVSPGQAAQMMDTVNNLQETIDKRKADMDAMSNIGNN
ncbi:MAG: hypothetical protein VB957_11435 [Pseudomonadales bacterium]